MTHILVDEMLKHFFKWVYRLRIFTAEECKNHFKPTKINGNVKKKVIHFHIIVCQTNREPLERG